MTWVLAGTLGFYGGVLLPIVYSYVEVHGRDLGKLWGYAPNQFAYLVFVFPFAVFYAFLALRTLVTEIRPTLPISDPTRFVLDHWSAWLILGFAFVSVFTAVIYFNSSMALDKLRPPHAMAALNAMEAFDRQVGLAAPEEQAALRERLIAEAHGRLAALEPPDPDDTQAVDAWLQDLARSDPPLFLQVVQRPSTQLRLQLLEPTVHALNAFQILLALMVAAVTVVSVAMAYLIAERLAFPARDSQALRLTLQSLSTAVFFFALYPLFYNQQRVQIEPYVGVGGTVLQQVFAMIAVVAILVWMNHIEPSGRAAEWVVRYVPVVVVGSGFAVGLIRPELLTQLIGKDTSLGIQLLLALSVMALGALPAVRLIWLRG